MICHLKGRVLFIYKDVHFTQPEVMPSCVTPIQQAPDFPSPQSNGWLRTFGSSSGLFSSVDILGFGWGCFRMTGSPGWGGLGAFFGASVSAS